MYVQLGLVLLLQERVQLAHQPKWVERTLGLVASLGPGGPDSSWGVLPHPALSHNYLPELVPGLPAVIGRLVRVEPPLIHPFERAKHGGKRDEELVSFCT